MNKQILISPKGERMVVLPEADYESLLRAAEDAEDIAAYVEFKAKLSSGTEELLPSDFVMRLVDGANPIRAWREYRGISAKELAEKAGIAQAYLSQLETGKREGPVATIKKIAEVLNLTIDDLAP